MAMRVLTAVLSLLVVSVLPAAADPWTEIFSIDSVEAPPGVDNQIGGIGALPDGRLAVCFHRGEVMIYDPGANTWSLFAYGLQEPLGVVAESESSLVIMQRPELTRLRDTDGDGVADEYETIFDGFGLTGNYHEFAFGPARDRAGNYYFALNVASNHGGIREEIRGEWSPIGLERESMIITSKEEWEKLRGKAGRMYSRVPYRGWVIRVSPDGREFSPVASGFRSPDGIGFDAEGRLLVTDNQGDWLGTSKVYDVRPGGFHGHPASLVWREGWKRNPLEVPVDELDGMRTPAMGLFPQGELANSPTQPIAIPEGVFGPLAGQTLIGEMNQKTLIRFLPDPVGEVSQGAAIPFLQSEALGAGNHRLAFTEDGSLWIGKTHLSWAGAEGLKRVRWTGKPFLAVVGVELVEDGFSLRFSRPVDPESLGSVSARRHTYHYHAKYGSPKVDEEVLEIGDARLSSDGLTLMLRMEDLEERFLYTLGLSGLQSTSGEPLLGDVVYYQLNKRR